MPMQVMRHRFTVEDYDRMAQAGIFSADDRVELIEGEIVQMAGIGVRHAQIVNRLTMLLASRLTGRAIVSIQNPVRLSDDSEPQPDVAILKPGGPSAAHPGPADILLVIEVSDSSIDYDRGIKLPLYAKTGIPEAWVVDVEAGTVEVHRQPSASGYAQTQRRARGETVTPEAFPDVRVLVEHLVQPGSPAP